MGRDYRNSMVKKAAGPKLITFSVHSNGSHHLIQLPADHVLHIKQLDGSVFHIRLYHPETQPIGPDIQKIEITLPPRYMASIESQHLNGVIIKPRLNS